MKRHHEGLMLRSRGALVREQWKWQRMASFLIFGAVFCVMSIHTLVVSRTFSRNYKEGGSSARFGVKSPSIAFVTFSHLSNLDSFQYLILPSLEMWLPEDALYFVVLSKNWKSNYTRFCKNLPEAFLNSTRTDKHFCDRIWPIFVDCPDSQWGYSPCCKQERGLLEIHRDYGNAYDWFVYADDDMYLRVGVLEGILRQLDPSVPQIATSGALQSETTPLGKSGYLKEDSPYNCSTHKDKMYPWGQPVVYSRAGLARIQHGLQLEGLTKECTAFDVTHDTGNAIFHYMHSLPEVRFGVAQRIFFNFDMQRWSGYELAGFHGIKATERSIRKFMTMAQVHEAWNSSKYAIPKLVYHRPKGFTGTSLYKRYGDVERWTEWHTFEPKDCI